ncbi:oligosaccharide flippase family protein [Vibrio tritonius]|uniref:oligosaccharide flippase family protein n=1 Tax=Vibrio tritonius TaxID=1435069 RepID=UPI0008397D89|nr:polysaccharide biosynthesis C-terminal domain-containing protein [Vibrio tritonius]
MTKNSLLFVISKLLGLILTFFTTALVARHLSVAEFGLYSIVKVVFSFVFVISCVVNDAYIISEMKDNPKNVVIINFIRHLLYILLSVIIFFYFDNNIIVISIMALYFFQLSNLGVARLNFSNSGKLILLINISSLFISLMISYFIYIYSHEMIISLLIVLPLFYFLLQVFCLFFTDVRKFYFLFLYRFKSSEIKENLLSVWPILITSLLILAYTRVDYIVISYYLTKIDLGIYAVSGQISEPFSFAISAYASSIIIKIKSIDDVEERNRYISSQLKYVHLYSIVLCIMFYFFGQYFISVFFGDKYLSSYIPAFILLFGKIFVFSNLFFSFIMIIDSKYKVRMVRTFYGIIVNIILNFILIPLFGIIGAAVATSLSQLITLTIINYCSVQTRDYFYVFINSFRLGK